MAAARREPLSTWDHRWLALAVVVGCAPAPVVPPGSLASAPAAASTAAIASEPTSPLVEPVDEAPRQEPPDIATGAAGTMPPRFGALGVCTLSGIPRRLPVRIDPASGASFVVDVSRASVDVTMGKGDGAAARVTAAQTIRFEGSARAAVLTLRKAVVRHEGMVRAPRGARVTAEHELSDGQVRVDTSIDLPIDVPCDHLALGGRDAPEAAVAQALPNVVPLDDAPLLLASSPHAVPTLPLPPGLVFTRLAGGVAFVKISHRGWDGVTVSGYLPAPRLMDSGLLGIGSGAGGCGCGGRAFTSGHRGPNSPFQGRAKLREGALIHAERGGGVWARGVDKATVEVTWKGGDDPWVKIDVIDGVDDAAKSACGCPGITHAFVLRGGVEF